MFKHLKAEEFVNLLEGGALPEKRRTHFDACERCRATWQSMRSMHEEVSTLDSDIPEPDWSEFRASVRDEMLSRSVQRASAVRRWTGWPVRPAVAWAASLLLTIGITGSALMWWTAEEPSAPPAPIAVVEPIPLEEHIDFTGLEDEMQVWSQQNLFDELAQLGEKEQQQLREMLQTAQEETATRE